MLLSFQNFLDKHKRNFRERTEINRSIIENGHWGISGHYVRTTIFKQYFVSFNK